jgi:putative transposase/transposase-like zinc-binding protein
MTRPTLEVADVVRQYGAAYLARYGSTLSTEQHRALRAIAVCRTAALGGHATQCEQCGHLEITSNSCGNRHCPKCPGRAQAAWLAAREAELLDVPYVHVVFTLPHLLSPLALQNPRVMYNLLLQAVAETRLTVARDPHHLGADIGFLTVLHTWGQTLHHHPHLHCVVPGGGLSPDGTQWSACRPTFFLPVRVLSRVFRRLFLTMLCQPYTAGALTLEGHCHPRTAPARWQQFLRPLRATEWVVYAKPPVGGPGPVLKSLARYTHRVAIANRRRLALEDGRVTFRWKDYAHGNRHRLMTLDAVEFLRRFLLPIFPAGFQRLRHYGLLANRVRQAKLGLCRVLLQQPVSPTLPGPPDRTAPPAPDQPAALCPACQRGQMSWVETLRRQPDLCARWMRPLGWDTS